MEQLTSRQLEAIEALGDLLRAYPDVWGPHGEPEDGPLDAAEMAETQPIANAALTDFVAVMAWIDLDSGETYSSKANRHGMPEYAQKGLLAGWAEAI